MQQVLTWLLENGGPWAIFLAAIYLFRDYIEFRFRPPPGSGGGRGKNQPRA